MSSERSRSMELAEKIARRDPLDINKVMYVTSRNLMYRLGCVSLTLYKLVYFVLYFSGCKSAHSRNTEKVGISLFLSSYNNWVTGLYLALHQVVSRGGVLRTLKCSARKATIFSDNQI